jgi:hypothetical protein
MTPNPAFQATLRIKPRKSPELYVIHGVKIYTIVFSLSISGTNTIVFTQTLAKRRK